MCLEADVELQLFAYMTKTYRLQADSQVIAGNWIEIEREQLFHAVDMHNLPLEVTTYFVSSKFDGSTSKRFGIVKPEFDEIPLGCTYFAEVQTSYKDPSLFLAVLERKREDGKRYKKWLTNDVEYAKNKPECFDPKMTRLTWNGLDLRAFDAHGRVLRWVDPTETN